MDFKHTSIRLPFGKTVWMSQYIYTCSSEDKGTIWHQSTCCYISGFSNSKQINQEHWWNISLSF